MAAKRLLTLALLLQGSIAIKQSDVNGLSDIDLVMDEPVDITLVNQDDGDAPLDYTLVDSTMKVSLMSRLLVGVHLGTEVQHKVNQFQQLNEDAQGRIIESLKNKENSNVQTEWGFLKNIININCFFASDSPECSGSGASPPKAIKPAKEEVEEPPAPKPKKEEASPAKAAEPAPEPAPAKKEAPPAEEKKADPPAPAAEPAKAEPAAAPAPAAEPVAAPAPAAEAEPAAKAPAASPADKEAQLKEEEDRRKEYEEDRKKNFAKWEYLVKHINKPRYVHIEGKEFMKPEKFTIMMYWHNTKGSYDFVERNFGKKTGNKVEVQVFEANSYLEAVEYFSKQINHWWFNVYSEKKRQNGWKYALLEFGLLGDNQLLISTSAYDDYYKTEGSRGGQYNYTETGKEYEKDRVSKLFIGRAVVDHETIKLPKGTFAEKDEYVMLSQDLKTKKISKKGFKDYDGAMKAYQDKIKGDKNFALILDQKQDIRQPSFEDNDSDSDVTRSTSYILIAEYLQKNEKVDSGLVINEDKTTFEFKKESEDRIKAIPDYDGKDEQLKDMIDFHYFVFDGDLSRNKGSLVQKLESHKYNYMSKAFAKFKDMVHSYDKKGYDYYEWVMIANNRPIAGTVAIDSFKAKMCLAAALKGPEASPNGKGTLFDPKIQKGDKDYTYWMITRDLKTNKTTGTQLKVDIEDVEKAWDKEFEGRKVPETKKQKSGLVVHHNGEFHEWMYTTAKKPMLDLGAWYTLVEYMMKEKSLFAKYSLNEKDAFLMTASEYEKEQSEKADKLDKLVEKQAEVNTAFMEKLKAKLATSKPIKLDKEEHFFFLALDLRGQTDVTLTMKHGSYFTAYTQFTRLMERYGKKNIPYEYYLFDDERLLLSSAKAASGDTFDIGIGYAFDQFEKFNLDDTVWNPDAYKGYFMLLQDRKTDVTDPKEKCGEELKGECQSTFEKKTDPEKGTYRGVVYNSSGVFMWSETESQSKDSKKERYMTTRNQLRAMLGKEISKQYTTLFSSVFYTECLTATVPKTVKTKKEMHRSKTIVHSGTSWNSEPVKKAVYHIMINKKVNEKKFSLYDETIKVNVKHLDKMIEYYTNPQKWWTQHDKNDVVTVLMADVNTKKSIVVMMQEDGQKLDDPRMFVNIGKLHTNKAYVPTDCKYKWESGGGNFISDRLFKKKSNMNVLFRSPKDKSIKWEATGSVNTEKSMQYFQKLMSDPKKSTLEGFIIGKGGAIRGKQESEKNPLGNLEILGKFLHDNCEGYQKIHPTMEDLGELYVEGDDADDQTTRSKTVKMESSGPSLDKGKIKNSKKEEEEEEKEQKEEKKEEKSESSKTEKVTKTTSSSSSSSGSGAPQKAILDLGSQTEQSSHWSKSWLGEKNVNLDSKTGFHNARSKYGQDFWITTKFPKGQMYQVSQLILKKRNNKGYDNRLINAVIIEYFDGKEWVKYEDGKPQETGQAKQDDIEKERTIELTPFFAQEVKITIPRKLSTSKEVHGRFDFMIKGPFKITRSKTVVSDDSTEDDSEGEEENGKIVSKKTVRRANSMGPMFKNNKRMKMKQKGPGGINMDRFKK